MAPITNNKYKPQRVFLFATFILCYVIGFSQPVANFSATSTKGCVPLTINFIDLSSGNPTTWQWDFGNGTTSNLQSPTVNYSIAGNYTIFLKVSNASGSNSITKINYITIDSIPVVNFSSTDSVNCKIPFTTQFEDLSSGGSSWIWNFGDGATSTLQNPIHTYNTFGQFNVSLTVNNASGCATTVTKNKYIKTDTLTIKIDSIPKKGCIPLTFNAKVQINDSSNVATYLWDFGDGNTSTLPKPTNIYTDTGMYTLKLFITTNEGCTDSVIIDSAVQAGIPPLVSFTFSPLAACVGQNVFFTGISALANSWDWAIGDGTTIGGQNPIHAYKTPGTFSVVALAIFNGCVSSISHTVKILPPLALFTPVFDCTNKTHVTFTDNSILPQTWSWNLGDGNTSTSQNLSYNYAALGTYNVSLTVTNAGCSNTKITPIKLVDEHADFSTPQSSVCRNSPIAFSAINSIPANITNYTFDFGDGTIVSSTMSSVTHIYTSSGPYSVKLTITDIHGCKDSLTKTDYIMIYGPVAKFSALTLVGCYNVPVVFADSSLTDGIHPIANWQWNYGDGIIQNLTSPPFSHLYDSVGSFIPQLKITDTYGCSDSFTYNTIKIIGPVAGFNSQDTLVCSSTSVTFNNYSTGTNLTYAWSLGNDSLSALVSPVTSYLTDSSYSVKLVVTDVNGCQDSLLRNNYINVKTVKASFSISDSVSSCSPLNVAFTNTAVNDTGFVWDFGDGTSSTAVNPTHTYSVAGSYTATLVTSGPGGCTDSAKHTIQLFSSAATFTYSPTAGCSQLTTNFHINSSGPVIYYFFDFGDGDTSSSWLPDITHTYSTPGSYLPVITVNGPAGCHIPVTGSDTILVTKSIPGFIAADSVACLGTPVTFNNTTTGNAPIAAYRWDFGDGDIDSATNPTHLYKTSGNFTVQLIVTTSNGCSDSSIKINYIHIYGPVAKFSALTLAGCYNVNVTFADSSLTDGIHPIANWQWNYGDGIIQNLTAPPFNHIYDSAGSFTPQLKITDTYGCSDSFTLSQPVFVTNPKVAFVADDTLVCIGTNVSFNNTSSGVDLTYAWSLGNDSLSALVSPVTSYLTDSSYSVKLVVTDVNGCQDSLLRNNYINVKTVKASFSISDSVSSCSPLNVAFTNTAVNDTGFVWDFGDGTSSTAVNPTHTYSVAGSYTATLVTSGPGGCTDSAKHTIQLFSSAATFTYSPTAGCSQLTTNFHINSSGPVIYYFFDFGDGDTSSSWLPDITHTYSTPGSYLPVITVNGPAGCHIPVTGSDTILVTKSIPGFIAADSVACLGTPVTFNNTTTGNAPIAAYRWDFGDGDIDSATNPTHLYKTSGNFTVQLIVTTSNGCSDSSIKINYIHIYGPVAKFSALTLAGCYNVNVTFADSSLTDGIHPIANWQWNYGDGIIQNLTAPPFNHIYDSAGSFTPQLKITDTYGCSDSFTLSQPVFVTNPKVAFVADDTLVCIGTNVSFNNTSSGVDLTYAWSLGNDSLSALVSPVTSYLTDSSYSVKLVVTDVNGCQDSLLRNNYINVKTVKASFSISDSVSSCSPLNVAFTNTAVNDTGFVWDFGDGTSSTAVNPTHTYSVAGSYTATLVTSGPGGCTDSAKHTIQLFSSAATFTYSPTAGCSQLTTNFHINSSGPVIYYFFDFGDGDTSSSWLPDITHTYSTPGSYLPVITVNGPAGCHIPVTGSDTIFITKSIPGFIAADSVACLGTPVTFNNMTTGNAPIAAYHWDFGDGDIDSASSPTHLYKTSGNYTVQLIVTTTNGCSDSSTKINYIHINPIPKAQITGDSTSCAPASLVFTGVWSNPDTSTITWNWNFGNGDTSTLQSPPSQQFNIAGNFPIQLILSTASNCADTVNTNIIIHPLPITSAGNEAYVCLKGSVQLQASGADSYTWSPGTYLSCTSCANPISTPLTNIVYYVTGTTTYGCETKDSVSVNIRPLINLTVMPTSDSICTGQSVQLTANGADQYEWIPQNGLSNAFINDPVAMPGITTSYKVIAKDNANCYKDSAIINISIFPYPTVEAGSNENIPFGGSVTLTPTYSQGISAWMWSPSTGLNCTDCPNPIASPENSTIYTITVTNSAGCSAKDDISVFLPCEGSIFIPNTFSPNNDGVNDIFYPRGKDINVIKSMAIFDRWGELVFQRSNFAPNVALFGWDGSFNGKPASTDVYLYIIQIICNNGNISTFKGNVALIR